MSYPPIYVLRHGQTLWNAEGRFQGALNSPLTARGIAHAQAQGAALAGLDLSGMEIRVSPQGRAFETAAIALARRADFLRTDDRLREIEVGDWSGKLRADIHAPGLVTEDTPDGPLALYEHAPGGEGFAALRVRVAAFLDDLTGPTICVTHGITSRMLRTLAMGQPVASLSDRPGGQGMVYTVIDGVHGRLGEGLA